MLPTIRVPTLVLHAAGTGVKIGHARYLADHILGARSSVPGVDHLPWLGDVDGITDAVVEFLTEMGHVVEADRVLATVLYTDVVSPRQRGDDARWRGRLETHQALVRRELYRGREISTAEDGFLATFDGPTGCGALCLRHPRCGAVVGAGSAHRRAHRRGGTAR